MHKYLYLLLIVLLFSCEKESAPQNEVPEKVIRICAVTDLHFFDDELGSGDSFENYLKSENKLVAESDAIKTAFFENLNAENFDVLFISGDITKDGELHNHLIIKNYLDNLIAAGKKVFVIPGNHDINNIYSYKYTISGREKIPNISPEKFKEIYYNCGYAQAFSIDNNSLSYAADLNEDYILLALDASKYEQYGSQMISSGVIKPASIEWIKSIIKTASEKNKQIIALLHHSLIEHFPMQSANSVTADYVLENSKEIAELLANGNVKLVFTGHFHANDISKYESSQSKIIYDIETGSAVTYPHSYRIIELTKNKAKIKTNNITNIKYKDITDFYAYSKDKTRNLLGNYFNAYWKQFVNLYKDYDDATKAEIKTAFISAVFAHYKGDEKISAQDQELLSKFANSEDLGLIVIAQLMSMIYNDTEPQDLNLEIDF